MKTEKLVAELQVSYKTKVKDKDRKKIDSSKDAERIFRSVWGKNIELQEEFAILCLNRSNKVIGWVKLSQGGMTGTVVDVRLVFSIALKCCATGLILGHNHPSGAVKPSEMDKNLTKVVKEAGKLFDIAILDHIILTADDYLSFADEGII